MDQVAVESLMAKLEYTLPEEPEMRKDIISDKEVDTRFCAFWIMSGMQRWGFDLIGERFVLFRENEVDASKVGIIITGAKELNNILAELRSPNRVMALPTDVLTAQYMAHLTKDKLAERLIYEGEYPTLVGIHEAAMMIGKDKRIITKYIERKSFPAPIQNLACGQIWTTKQIEDYIVMWEQKSRNKRSQS